MNEFGLILSTFHCTGEELTALALKCVSDDSIPQNVSKQLMNINKNLYAKNLEYEINRDKKKEYVARETPKVSGSSRNETNLPSFPKTTDVIRSPILRPETGMNNLKIINFIDFKKISIIMIQSLYIF